MSPSELEDDLVILACAVGAGIHGALVPGRFADGAGAGLGFAAAAASLAGLAVWLTRRPAKTPALASERNTDVNTTRAPRPIPLVLTVLVAVFSALAALAVSNGHDAHARASGPHEATAHVTAVDSQTVTRKELALRNTMRQLWEDHIVWTRLAIVSLTTNSPDTEASVGRLLKNQADIGNAVKPFYGEAAGDRLTDELRRHIFIAADLIAAARAGDQARLAEAQARWEQNADVIAAVLSSINPRYFDSDVLETEMRMHLKLTTEEVVARLQGDWAADVAAYDRIHGHILHLSDYLSAGIVKQFPKRFRTHRGSARG